MNNVVIAPIHVIDYEELVLLFKEFAAFQKVPHLMKNTVDQMELEAEYLKGFTLKDGAGRLIGYATFFFAYYTWYGKSLYMDDLYVSPEYRGQGFGTKLIEQVIAYAKEKNCKKLRWQVSSWNKSAIGFYKSLGAEVCDLEMNCDLII